MLDMVERAQVIIFCPLMLASCCATPSLPQAPVPDARRQSAREHRRLRRRDASSSSSSTTAPSWPRRRRRFRLPRGCVQGLGNVKRTKLIVTVVVLRGQQSVSAPLVHRPSPSGRRQRAHASRHVRPRPLDPFRVRAVPCCSASLSAAMRARHAPASRRLCPVQQAGRSSLSFIRSYLS